MLHSYCRINATTLWNKTDLQKPTGCVLATSLSPLGYSTSTLNTNQWFPAVYTSDPIAVQEGNFRRIWHYPPSHLHHLHLVGVGSREWGCDSRDCNSGWPQKCVDLSQWCIRVRNWRYILLMMLAQFYKLLFSVLVARDHSTISLIDCCCNSSVDDRSSDKLRYDNWLSVCLSDLVGIF